MSFNNQVIAILDTEHSASVHTIASKTGLSVNYVRVQLRFMEQAGVIEKVDERLPIIYKLSPSSPVVRNMERIANIKQRLLTGDAQNNPIIEALLSIPKAHWAEAIPGLEALAEAIKDLNADNKLVDTL